MRRCRGRAESASGCDCIYVPSGLKAFLYAQLIRRRGRPLVAGPNVTRLPIRRADSPGWIELRAMCDLWLEASDARRGHVLRHVGAALENRVVRVHHAIDSRKFSPERRDPSVWKKHGLDDGKLKILWVGKDYAPRKGTAVFLAAADAYSRMGNMPDAYFVVIGTLSAPNAERAKNLPNVRHLGPVFGDDLAVLYASADMSTVPSSWESFSFTTLEAMVSGLPVLATRAGAIPELIEDGVSGLLLDLCDKERGWFKAEAPLILAEAIGRVAGDADLRRRLGENARKRAVGYFSESRLGDDMMKVFKSLLEGVVPSSVEIRGGGRDS